MRVATYESDEVCSATRITLERDTDVRADSYLGESQSTANSSPENLVARAQAGAMAWGIRLRSRASNSGRRPEACAE